MKTIELVSKRFVALILLIVTILSSEVDAQHGKYFRFDFGNEKSPLAKYSVLADSSSFYSKEKGFGFLSANLRTYYDSDLEKITNQTTCDGLSSKELIEFRVDLEPGEYIIEILMHGGERTLWEGSISINNNEVAKRLLCYSANYEGQSPPPYWGIVRKFSNKDNQMVFKIDAEQQPSTISGINIYSAEFGSINHIDGKAVAVNKLKAPNADFVLELINKAKILEAKKIIDAIPVSFRYEKALLLFALSSRIEVPNPRDYIEPAYYYLRDEAEADPRSEVLLNLRFAELILNANHFQSIAGWMWNKDLYPQSGFFGYVNIAGDSYEEVSAIPEHPLYLAATWLKAKTAYWIYIEQHEEELILLADKYFRILKKYFPDNELLNEYLGLKKYDVGIEIKPDSIPEWAFLQNKIAKSLLEIIYHWVDSRQAENGEFGGKYDDDVEMLRWWPISRLAFNDTIALKGMKKIVDGIWKSDWIYKGFSKKVRDVEHSSEPVADTQPMMIGLDYGNPIYVERCMESVKGIRDLWTGINSKGHRHFKSSWYSSTAIDTTSPKDCDLEMNTRTVKAALWLAWYNRHPFVMQFLKEWGDSWLEDCMRTDKGKPRGVVPAAVRFSDDAIGGYADNWHHPNMSWDYFNYRGGAKMLTQFLITSILLNDDKYLEPIELSLNLMKKYKGEDLKDAPLGSEKYAVGVMRESDDFWETVELWRLYKNNNKYDDLISEVGSPYIRYYLSKNVKELTSELKKVFNEMVNNFTLNTSEGYFTDRIDLGDMRKQDSPAGGMLEAMYLGSSLAEVEFPFNRISWKGFDSQFSALVTESNSSSISLITFLDKDTALTGEIVFLDFIPGSYSFKSGEDTNGDSKIDLVQEEKTFMISGRNSSTVLLVPAGVEQLVEIRMIKKSDWSGTTVLPDLAITKEELSIVKNGNGVEITIPVHNIGIADASNVECLLNLMGESKSIFNYTIDIIKAPLDLDPKVEIIVIKIDQRKKGTYTFSVNANKRIKELNDRNNEISFSL